MTNNFNNDPERFKSYWGADYRLWTDAQLKDAVRSDHDCTLEPENGCVCVFWSEELAQRQQVKELNRELPI